MTKVPTKTRKPEAKPRTTRGEDMPEAQPTRAKAQAAAKEQFAEADAAAAEDTKLRTAALGGY